LDAEMRAQGEAELAAKNELSAMSLAASLFGPFSTAADGSEPYLKNKRVGAYGLRKSASPYAEIVIMPLRDVDGRLWSYQEIWPNGEKRFMTGGRKRGCFHTIGELVD